LPIDKTAYGEGTFKVFGRVDEKGYLDKYSIRESIEDGTTLQLNYTLAPSQLPRPRGGAGAGVPRPEGSGGDQ
jgi:type I restriction enzyme R subunit